MARRLICRDQDVSDVVPVICNGWAAWYINVPHGGRQIISFILPGELASAALVFDPIQYCCIDAITDCQFRTFKRNELIKALFRRRDALERIAQIWIDEKKRSDQLIVDLGRRLAEQRIARLIMQLAERVKSGGTIGSAEPLPFPLRQHHIADATGLTPVHVGKVLSELGRRNILAIRGRSLSILDPAAFVRLAGVRPSRSNI
ncbi:MAG: Crp/Fnr family transcriptional regulator [Pseudolabrys sp.]